MRGGMGPLYYSFRRNVILVKSEDFILSKKALERMIWPKKKRRVGF